MIFTARDFHIPIQLRVDADTNQDIPAKLCAVENGYFQVRSPALLKSGVKIEVVHPDARMQAVAAHCHRVEGGFYQLAIVLAQDLDRRSQPRISADWPATLHIAGSPGAMRVKIVDMSRSGLGLDVPAALAVGTRVTVAWEAAVAHGEICHCAKNAAGCRAGMCVREFVLREAKLAMVAGAGWGSATTAWARSVQQRQAAYEAILFSLAEPVTAREKTSFR